MYQEVVKTEVSCPERASPSPCRKEERERPPSIFAKSVGGRGRRGREEANLLARVGGGGVGTLRPCRPFCVLLVPVVG